MKIVIIISFVFIFCYCKNSRYHENSNTLRLSDTELIKMETNHSLQIIDTRKAIKKNTNEIVDMIDEVYYIPLDSEELIGEISKMVVTKDKIFILDSHVAQKIIVFDKEGHFLFQIKDQGQGPTEYVSLWDMQIDTLKNEVIVNDALMRSYIYYSTEDGKFIRKIKGISNCYFAKQDNKYINLLNYGQDFNEEEDWSIIITDKDSIIKKGFEQYPMQRGDYIMNSLFSDVEGSLLYTPIYSDTIYQLIIESSSYPKYVILQNKSIWKLKNQALSPNDISRLIKEEDYTCFSGVLYHSNDYAIFNILHSFREYVANKSYIWNEKMDELYEWDKESDLLAFEKDEKVVRKLKHIIPSPTTVYKNMFYGIITPFPLDDKYEYLDKNLKSILKNLDDDSNPILVIYSFKS